MRMAIWAGILGTLAATALPACGNSSTTGGGGSGGGSGAMVNACDAATAEDHTGDATTTIGVGTTGLTFTPACIKIKKGNKDAASPIAETTTGTTATFTFPAAGTFGFFCEFHVASGMKGAVFVE